MNKDKLIKEIEKNKCAGDAPYNDYANAFNDGINTAKAIIEAEDNDLYYVIYRCVNNDKNYTVNCKTQKETEQKVTELLNSKDAVIILCVVKGTRFIIDRQITYAIIPI